MSTSAFFIPSLNLMGAGCLQQAVDAMRGHGFRRALIVTDQGLVKAGLAAKVADMLGKADIEPVIFDGVHPNPSCANVNAGLALLKEKQCDVVVSLGGGSPHDCAKGIALVAVNGGKIQDYEGVDKSAKPQLPLVAINTTAGTASEMTRFCIITDESRHIKMAIVDKHTTPILSVNDPETMAGMPASLTAATGMDALTHAVEAYVSTIATPITDACALKAVELIAGFLRRAVKDGKDMEAREQWLTPSSWPAWPSTTPRWAMCTRWRTSWAASTTCRTACATRCCCRMCRPSTQPRPESGWATWPSRWARRHAAPRRPSRRSSAWRRMSAFRQA